MEISEVRIKLMEDQQERLQAFCSITFDHCFVIRDLKIIEGIKGSFVAMPSRKLTDRCPQCHTKNQLRASYCNQCGTKLMEDRATRDDEGRAKLYADIAHPINARCRELIQTRVLEAFREELIRAQQPGYVCTYDDFGEDRYATIDDEHDYLPRQRDGYVGSPQTTYRIENGAAHVNAPHASVPFVGAVRDEQQPVLRQEPETVAVPSAPKHRGHEEGFGAGIL